MQLIHETPDIRLRPSVATIGFFDGVHRGHRYLIEQVRAAAAERGLASAVVTFPVHPRKVVQADYHPKLLTTCDEKVSLLAKTRVDYCMMLDFTPETARLSAREFMSMLKDRYRIQALAVGYDHRFGHNRSEGFEDYVRYGRELGMEVLLARAYSYNKKTSVTDNEEASVTDNKKASVTDNKKASVTADKKASVTDSKEASVTADKEASVTEVTVSSSVIRRLLQEGNVSEAAEYLGYDFFLDGTVVGGYRVGRKIGFPTANLRVSDPDKLIPCDGVYAARVCVAGKEYGGMLSIGYRPTFENGPDRSIEVHIFRFDADIYQQPMRISFVRYMRPELKFNSIEELIARLHRDEEEVKAMLSL